MTNGAQALMKTLVDAGVEVCFSNPGTSEMHFVAALDDEPKMRAVLALFEGVATGAADGYARMADKPAATLLHLGCGLGNGLANLHNARKGKVPVLNIVGDHATYHVKYDAQLQSDIETVARNVSPGFVRTAKSTETLCQDAAHSVGFTYLTNFGMSKDMLEAGFAVAHSLFKSDEKLKVPFNPEVNHGYTGMQGEALDPTKPADLKETFTCRDLSNRPSGPDYWPNPQFEAFMRVFYNRIVQIASDVMGAFALALNLPPEFFDEKHTGITQTLRLLHYPPAPDVSEGQLGAGAHTDYGTLTVLFQDDAGGLQVQNLAGEWIDAPPVPGSVIINTGDLMARWSNDVFKSTPHRVVPRPGAMKNGRQSIAFFSDPDPDVMIETFPGCITEDAPAKYGPISAGEHIKERIMASQAK